ncbi:uncharacterized protein EV420DRAFT_1647821 [Desarmillaria tabescens]|uniref:CCHC-type domain-containing protein n=1 Tax=Armillaria tabescens TaxID=1929756 RepID=A0AA39JRC9_ARMTA|nr:uncharacterized protein EV420DRAFT_1647821 [Desarmillaria tabescens]KAK0447490.1 hypothetical protein EV420DRAFT_1647821 [Desarmillaria tabescens]
MDSADYLNYRREFQAKSKQVIKENLMLNLDLVRLFISPFEHDTLWKRMRDRLSSQPAVPVTAANPARTARDPWPLEDMFDAGTWVLKGPGAVYNELFDGSLPKVDSSPKVEAPGASASRGIMTLKKEPAPAALSGELHNFLAEMVDSNRLIVKLLENQVTSQGKRDEELHKMLAQIKAQPRPTQLAPAPSTHGQFGSDVPGNCHFCETPGHYQVDCPYKLEMITTGELVHVPGTQNMYRLRDGNPPPREPTGMSQKARIQHYYETHKASGSNQVGQTYIAAPQLPGPVPQYVMSHQIAEEKEDISYLRNMLEKLVQQTSHLAPDKVDQYLEGPRWESVVKTRGQQHQEASQANDAPQDTQDFRKRSMKAGEHHKKAAAVAGPVDSSPEDVIQNQKRGAEAENWRSRPKLQSKYTPNSSSNNDENLVPDDPDVVDQRSRSVPPVISVTGNDGHLEPENPYAAVPDVTLLPSPGRVEKISVLPGEVRKEPAYRKKVEAQSGDLEKEVWDQMMKAPITLTAEHWLASSPGARQKMKTYVTLKRIPTSKVLLEDLTDTEEVDEQEAPRVPLGSVANILEPGLENCIRIEDLPVECGFYVTTMCQGLVPEGLTIISDPVVQYLESIPEGERAKTVVVIASSSQSLRSVYPLVSGRKKLECLCDSGSQIVSCSANLAKQMGWEYDPVL